MSNKEILERAIQKAIDGGWMRGRAAEDINFDSLIHDKVLVTSIIFNHDFAKALWGEELTHLHNGKKVMWRKDLPEGVVETTFARPKYEYHLQQMVIAEDPIEYLGKHLDD